MREILPGLFHWSVLHEPIGRPVSSYYWQPAGVVIDPKVPEGGLDALPGRPEQVLLTSGHHHRDAGRFADELGIPVRALREAVERIGDRLPVEAVGDGEQPAPGVTAIHIGRLSEDEGALHLAVAEGAVAFADGVHNSDGRLGFFPDQMLGDDPERVKRELREAFAELLARDFDHLLFAHGRPWIGGGRQALDDFVGEGTPGSG